MLDATESSNKRRVVGQFSFSANQTSENNVESSIWRDQDAFLDYGSRYGKGWPCVERCLPSCEAFYCHRVPPTKLTSRRPNMSRDSTTNSRTKRCRGPRKIATKMIAIFQENNFDPRPRSSSTFPPPISASTKVGAFPALPLQTQPL